MRHLHVHTEYSLLDGMCRLDALVDRMKELEMDSVAITDHGTMYGVIHFYNACRKAGIKPIIGLEAYVVPDVVAHKTLGDQIEEHKKARKKMTNREKQEDTFPLNVKDAFNRLANEDTRYFGNSVAVDATDETIEYKFRMSHLLLLARTNEGYNNLIRIASESQLNGFYYKPRVDMSLLKRYGKGIIATSACRGGEIPRLILRGRIDLAEELAREYHKVFDEFYLEVQPSENPEQLIVNQALIELSEKTGIPLVVTSDAHYIKAEEADSHEVLLAVSTGTSMDDEERLQFGEHVNYIMTDEEILRYGIPQIAIDNTHVIAEKCNIELELDKVYLPEVPIPYGYTKRQYISRLCYDGMYKYYGEMSPLDKLDFDFEKYTAQLEYELDVIETKGYIDYFLIVWDFIYYAKTHNVYVGPGRGSAAGSVVSFFLNITTLDPLKNGLIFERFLSPARPSMPDIDLDFEEYIDVPELFRSGRQEMIEYVVSKYGKDKIAQILALGTMGTRSVLKDVGRALNIDHNEINFVNKFIPMESGFQWPLSDCIHGNEKKERDPIPEVVAFAQKYPQLFEVSMLLEGMPRHTSIHAAGVVISPIPVIDLVPLCRGGDDEVVTQFDKDLLEHMGILKMDFLGLRTLGVIHRTVDAIKRRYGIDVDFYKIPLNDPKVLQAIKAGYTDGMFQIESDGFKSMFRSMNEVHFNDIVAANALYRPGPMQFIPQYIARKNGYSEVQYLFDELAPILGETYGIMVYQEQIMRIATDVAGFSSAMSDEYRRAIGKKKEELIIQQNNLLIYGSEESDKELPEEKKLKIPGLLKRGVPLDKAKQLADDIVAFAKYSFNKAHAACYTVVTMQTGWFKTYYPVEYMTYLISSYIGKDDEKLVKYINEAKRMGIKILPPDINHSEYEFSIEDDSIRYGLGAIKGLNKSAVLIMQERAKNGEYKSLEDFVERFDKRAVNKKAVDSLALAGVLTSISGLTDRFEVLKKAYALRGDEVPADFMDTFIEKTNDFVDIGSAKQLYGKLLKDTFLSEMQILQVEQSLLGMYISGHPLTGKAESTNWNSKYDGSVFDVTGIIMGVRKTLTKKKDEMAFVSFETLEGRKDIVVFPKVYEATKNKLDIGGIRTITVQCKVRRDDSGSISYLANNIKYYRGGSNNAEEIDQQLP